MERKIISKRKEEEIKKKKNGFEKWRLENKKAEKKEPNRIREPTKEGGRQDLKWTDG